MAESTMTTMAASPMYVRVAEVRDEALGIRSYRMVSLDGSPLPAFEAGAHIGMMLPGRLTRYYSLTTTPRDRNHYVIAIQREDTGRGGSVLAHRLLAAGRMVKILPPRNFFELAPQGTCPGHVLLAGGIGITPMLSMAAELTARGEPFHLSVFTRGEEYTPFRSTLQAMAERGLATLHEGASGADLQAMLADGEAGRHLYCCGSPGFMEAVRKASAHWPESQVHFESFTPVTARAGDVAFTLRAQQAGRSFQVAADQTVLQALRSHGINIDSVCENGTCGTCKVPLVSGDVDHRDSVLTEGERCSAMMACVSRARQGELVLDL